jgi:large exoprotein involved in heme utilization and adhesion
MGDIIIGSEEGEDSFIQTGDYWGGGKLAIDSRNEISINNSLLNISSRDVNNEDIIQKDITSPKGPFFPSGPFLGNGGQIILTSVDAITLSDSWLASNGLLGGNINLNSHNGIILQGLSKSGIISFTFGYNSDKKAENVSLSAPYLSFSNTHLFVDNYGDVVGGDLIINGENLQIIDDSEISTDTYDRGRAGNLVINMESIKISDSVIFASVNPSPPLDGFIPQQTMGKGANIIITTEQLYLTKSAGIQLNNFASGEPSSITVLANDKIILEDFTGILSVTDNSETNAIGNSGKVDLESKNGIFLNNSGITSYVELSSRGNAGEIRINTSNLKLENGSLITTQSLGIGNAGQITINAQESFVIDGAGKTVDFSDDIESLKNFRSGVLSSIEEMAIGQGGDIDISTNSLQIMNQGQLNVRTNGVGNAGNINIQANSIGLTNGGLINAAAEANAPGEGGIISARSSQEQGGNVEINLNGILQLRNQSQISASAGTQLAGGDGGNILINAQFLVANPFENSDITANAFTGQGGNINIYTQGIFGLEVREQDTPFSDITASSEFGLQGNITLDSLGIDPTRSLTILPQSLVTPELIQGCQKGEAKASFYDLGRGGIPTNPSDWFDAIPFPQENLIPLQPSPEKLKTPSSLHFSLPVMATRVIFTCTDP